MYKKKTDPEKIKIDPIEYLMEFFSKRNIITARNTIFHDLKSIVK